MRRPFALSLILHLVIVVSAILGLPSLRQPPVKEDEPVIVDLVAVSDRANPPPAAQLAPQLESPKPVEAPAPRAQPAQPQPEPKQEPPQAMQEAPADRADQPTFAARPEPARRPEPKAEPRPAPVGAEATKPERPEPKPEPKPEKAEAKPAPHKPEPKAMTRAEPEPELKTEPRPQAKPKPPVEPKEAKPESKPPPAPERKPEAQKPAETQTKPVSTPKQEATRTVQEPEPASDFASVSKAVQDLKRQQSGRENGRKGAPTPPAQTAPNEGDSALTARVAEALRSPAAATNKPSLPVTSTEIDAVRRQIERCWNLPEGAREAGNLVVSIRVEMNADGTPHSAIIQNAGQMQSNPHFQAAADSARRAVLNPRCHPFRLPADKFEHWRTMTLIFNPRDIS